MRDVPMAEASLFGIMNTRPDGTIYEFEEKPKKPKSTKASMGIYVFKWSVLKKYLEMDEADPKSENDFGKNIIPSLLRDEHKLVAYDSVSYTHLLERKDLHGNMVVHRKGRCGEMCIRDRSRP